MQRTSRLYFAVPVLFATVGMACGGSANDRAAETRSTQDARAGTQQVLLTGCVEAGQGSDGYVLRNVRLAPVPEQPSDALTAPGIRIISEGSWVRLKMNDRDELRSHLGQVVAVTGTVSDDGRDTIGTGGPAANPDEPQPRTDRSRAANPEQPSDKVSKEAGPLGQQSLANGTAPEIVVQRVNATGERCKGQ
jgi:hypothetical protein